LNVFSSAIELGFKKLRFFNVFKNNLKTLKAQFRYFRLFILCNLISKPHIKNLIVICDIHQFHLHFSHGVLLFRSLEICLQWDTAYHVWDVFHVLLGHTFVFGLHTKNLSNLKTLKTYKPENLFFKKPRFFQPWFSDFSFFSET